MKQVRPMLAASFDDDIAIEVALSQLNYPIAASPKIDGIRFMKPPNSLTLSRSWKPLPNEYFQNTMRRLSNLDFSDGEVIVGYDPTMVGLFNKTQSAIMSVKGEPNFSLWLFDNYEYPENSFELRTTQALNAVKNLNIPNVNYVTHLLLNNIQEILDYEEEAVLAGYEGIMLRNIYSKYKYGRSTLKEQGLIKIKRFVDEEAEIIGFEPLERNLNIAEKDNFGLQKRSSHKENKVSDNLLGKLIVRNNKWGEFTVGSGFDIETREKIWNNKPFYLGEMITFKYQSHGTKDKPRNPIFKGFRKD